MITCVSSVRNPASRSEVHRGHSPGKSYSWVSSPVRRSLPKSSHMHHNHLTFTDSLRCVWPLSTFLSSPVVSKSTYDHVVEEHFQRSLGANYQKSHSQQLSISVSVDDHFAKALGDKWLQIKSKSSSCSSTPPSSPSVTHSPTHSSPRQSLKESSSSSPTCSHWPVN